MRGSSLLAPIAKRLEGKVAVITGGASGIGRCTAKLFVQHGAKVVIADVQDGVSRSLCQDINNELPDSISFIRCDVSSDREVESLVDHTIDRYGKLDIMFSNAGISGNMDPTISAVNYNEFKRVFDVNTFGAFAHLQHHQCRLKPDDEKVAVLNTDIVAKWTDRDDEAGTTMNWMLILIVTL